MANPLFLQQLEQNQILRNQNYKLGTMLHHQEQLSTEYYRQISMQLEKITTQMKMYIRHHSRSHKVDQEAIHNMLQNCIIDLQGIDSPPIVQKHHLEPTPSNNIEKQLIQQSHQQLHETKTQLEAISRQKILLKEQLETITSKMKKLEEIYCKQSEDMSRTLDTVRTQQNRIKQLNEQIAALIQANHSLCQQKDEMFERLKQSKTNSNQYGLYLKKQTQQVYDQNSRLLKLNHEAAARQSQLLELLDQKQAQLKKNQEQIIKQKLELQALQLHFKQLIEQEEKTRILKSEKKKRQQSQNLRQMSNSQPRRTVGTISKKFSLVAFQSKLSTSNASESH